eukprot:jgi/Hompol1/6752/HPOL_002335-RA
MTATAAASSTASSTAASSTEPKKRGSFAVREITSADVETIRPIIHAAYRKEGGWTTEAHLVDGERITCDQILKAMQDPCNTILVAEDKDDPNHRLVGSIEIEEYDEAAHQPVHNVENHAGVAVLLGLFSVDPSYQSRGAGGALFRSALDRAREKGKKKAFLWVIHSRLELIAWYERMGFKRTGHTVKFAMEHLLKVDDGHFDEFVMEL